MEVGLLLIRFASLASGHGVREHTPPALQGLLSFILVALIYFVLSSQWLGKRRRGGTDVNETITPRDGDWARA